MCDDDKNQILDPAIKLFGKSIQLLETSSVEAEPRLRSDADAGGGDDDDVDERRSRGMNSGLEDESDDECSLNCEEPEKEQEDSYSHKANQRNATSGTDWIVEKLMDESKATILCSSRMEEENEDTALPQEKTLKKPDKIIPCPRCDSMDTKFCYFNNYNVNQPRYFCRNCQRYWTSGGTMRNLPVGAGRRKSKSSTVHYSNPTIAPHGDFSNGSVPHLNGTIHRPVEPNGAMLSFSPNQHIHLPCPPNAVDLASTQNGSANPLTDAGVVIDHNVTGPAGSVSRVENEDEYKAKENTAQSYQSFHPQILCYPAPLRPPFLWNPVQYNYPLPGPFNIGFPMPFYPTPTHMGCDVPGAWNLPWSPPSSSPNKRLYPTSQTLGKHSRDDCASKPSNVSEEENGEEECHKPSLWVPKTMRIDDLEETAKSSMWATLGIETDNTVSQGAKGHFKPFSSLTNKTSRPMITSSSLLANPAALSRAMNFRESM